MSYSRLIYLSAIFMIFVCAGAGAQESTDDIPYKVMPAKPGERCTICDVPLDEGDVALMVRGRRVPLDRSMVDSFMSNQAKYFAEKQPRSALFSEEMTSEHGVSLGGITLGWFIFGTYILVALIFGGLSGYAAISKGLPTIRYFFSGFVFIVFGYLYVLSRPSTAKAGEIPDGFVKVPNTAKPVACPNCGHGNHPSAKVCASCGGQLQPTTQSDVARVHP
jgi:putative flippase GtrA